MSDNNGILNRLKEKARAKVDQIPKEALIIRGIWHVEYAINLAPDLDAPILNLRYVVVQTINQGCSYYENQEDPGISEKFLGKNVLDFSTSYRCFDIAGLDAVYSHLIRKPDKSYTIEGANFDKAMSRANIVVNESLLTLRERKPKKGNKYVVVNVGVVDQFLECLSRHNDLILKASDYYIGIVDRQVRGIRVAHGTQTNKLIADADLAIITGMTLANGTLDKILDVAKKNNTRLAMFAETGSHFAAEYCQSGIDVVISEPLPFYLDGPGPCEINIYRS